MNKEHPTGTCRCRTARYTNERAAQLAAAQRAGQVAYRCHDRSVWHVTGDWFNPRRLQSRARVIAFYVWRHGEVGLRTLRANVVAPGSLARRDAADAKGWSYPRDKFDQVIDEMQAVGLLRQGGGLVQAVDRAGLLRVAQVGLDEYIAQALTELGEELQG